MQKNKIKIYSEISPDGSLNSSSASLVASDNNDNDSPKSMSLRHDKIINANINSSQSHLTANQPQAPSSIIGLKDYLHALERHKSIDNCFLSPSATSIERIYLFDEIKKLTNHLFKITTNHSETPDERSAHNNNTNMKDNNNILCKTINGTLVDDNNNKIDDFTLPSDDDGRDVTSTVIAADDDEKNSNQLSEFFKKFTQLADVGNVVNNSQSVGVPWAVTKRTKFRINQTSSRDVPIVKTERPAKLRKQNAIDAADTKIFDEIVNHMPNAASVITRKSIVDIFEEKFSNKSHQHLFQSNIRHETFASRLPNGSISFDCGQIGVEQHSINTIRALFQLHAATGTSVKQMQAQIESKNKV